MSARGYAPRAGAGADHSKSSKFNNYTFFNPDVFVSKISYNPFIIGHMRGELMKTLSLVLLALLLSTTAFAGRDRQPFTLDVLKTIQESEDAMDSFRVYLERKIKIKREDIAATNTDVNDGINRSRTRNVLSEKISRTLRGKIIDVTSDRHRNTIVFVSFDPSCVEQACAFGFGVRKDDAYLWYIPKRGMSKVTVKNRQKIFSKKWTSHNERSFGEGATHVYIEGGNKTRPTLEFKLSETDNIIRQNIRNRGWN